MAELFAHAKINLWLRIFAPDDTGYHPLDTLFCALELADEISITPARRGIEFSVSGADVGPHERNLAYRAAVEFFAACGLPANVTIHLHKMIPAGGGLGGGSADAAAVLMALNQQHDEVVPQTDLLAMAARLGSDVPFFLCGSALAHATGRGEQLQALPALPRAPVLVVVPPFAVSTVEAYRWLDEARAFSVPRATATDALNTWHDVAVQAVNDFEDVLFARHPELAAIRRSIAESGAAIALLSGSGSAVFGVYDAQETRDAAIAQLQRQFPHVRLVATSTRG